MTLIQQERLLRRLLRSLAWKDLKPLDCRRLARVTDALESDVLLSRILLRAARARSEDRASRPNTQPLLFEPFEQEDDEV